MEPTIFDIESDGLDAANIHCLSVNYKGKIKTTFDYDKMRSFFTSAKVLCGHNIQRYDIPTVERLLGIKVKAKLVDTLALSWYLEPDRVLHGLDEWGTEFGIEKPKIDDWDNLTPEEYQHRCEEDVKINTKLWERQWKHLVKLYESEEEAARLIDYLSFKMDCAAEQERSRWKLDVELCESSIASMSKERDYKVVELAKAMPQVPVMAKKTKPKKPFKQDGSVSATGEKWFSLLREQGLSLGYDGEVEYVTGYKEPNPGSHVQLKSWLYDLGWKPQNFDYKRNKETNEIRKIPQIKNEEGDGICESIKKLYKKEPRLELLDGLSVLNHRIALLKGFLGSVDDEGYVRAEIKGLTNTLRFKHKVVVNLPGVDKPYGDIIRGCLIAPDGYELCGSDMSSLEDRTKQHYMWPHDPEYVKEMITPDFDPHLDLAVTAQMMTQEQVDLYKSGDVDAKKKFKPVRHDAKQVNYSCTYGVTPAGLVRNTGMGLPKAEKLHTTYWKRNWSIQAIADNCVVKTCKGQRWLYNPVSKLWYSLRADKDRFSTLNQGTGVFCFDTWIKHVRSGGPPMVGQFHDEGIWCIRKGKREKMKSHLQSAINKTNEELKLDRELEIDVEFGDNYSSIH